MSKPRWATLNDDGLTIADFHAARTLLGRYTLNDQVPPGFAYIVAGKFLRDNGRGELADLHPGPFLIDSEGIWALDEDGNMLL